MIRKRTLNRAFLEERDVHDVLIRKKNALNRFRLRGKDERKNEAWTDSAFWGEKRKGKKGVRAASKMKERSPGSHRIINMQKNYSVPFCHAIVEWGKRKGSLVGKQGGKKKTGSLERKRRGSTYWYGKGELPAILPSIYLGLRRGKSLLAWKGREKGTRETVKIKGGAFASGGWDSQVSTRSARHRGKGKRKKEGAWCAEGGRGKKGKCRGVCLIRKRKRERRLRRRLTAAVKN